MMYGQTKTYGQANDMWKFLASGNYTVDAATKAQAQKDISEDGYWGVKQTSQILFDFACALAGDDVGKMKEMQAAVFICGDATTEMQHEVRNRGAFLVHKIEFSVYGKDIFVI